MDSSTLTLKHGGVPDRAFLFSALRTPNTILLESARQDEQEQNNYLFHSPIDILTANTIKDIPAVFQKIEKYIADNKWIAGYFGYECGYHFEKILRDFDNRTSLPLIYLGVYHTPLTVPEELMEIEIPSSTVNIQYPRLSISNSTYHHNIGRIKNFIVNGDIYQVNFTDRFEFIFSGDELELYLILREKQRVSFGGFLNLDEIQVLSFSPELFFRRKGNSIITKPMKGTCKRGRTIDEDKVLMYWLRNDSKNKSENLMIVDLLRNDLGRICDPGSIKVKKLYSVQRYETVLQMISTIEGTLNEGVKYYELFKALFPSGSVTGAPKIRTMQVIHETERHQRGIYCGAIGYISPNDEAAFNVAIRTVILNNGKGSLGVGSGIVFDSNPQKEYDECMLKAEFMLKEPARFQILETLLWKNEYMFLDEHLARMKQSANYFFYQFEKAKVINALKIAERTFARDKEYRVRLILPKHEEPFTEFTEITSQLVRPLIAISPDRTSSTEKFFFHKTSYRPLYNKYWLKAQNEQLADYIFLNEKNEITEGTISNIFIEKNKELITPPVSSGLLAGIYRQHILTTIPSASEKVLALSDLFSADAIYLCNSIYGWRKVTFIKK